MKKIINLANDKYLAHFIQEIKERNLKLTIVEWKDIITEHPTLTNICEDFLWNKKLFWSQIKVNTNKIKCKNCYCFKLL